MKTARRVVKNTGILYTKMIITVAISLYITRLVLDALGIEGLGIFTVVGSSIALLTFMNPPMVTASQRFMSYAQGAGDQHKQKSIFNISALLHMLIAIVTVLIIEIIGLVLFDNILQIDPMQMESAKLIYHFLAIGAFFTIISVPYDAVINAHENMLFVAQLGIVEVLMKLGVALYITYIDCDKLLTYGFLMALIMVAQAIIKGIYCHVKYSDVEFGIYKYFDKETFKHMLGFSGWSFLGSSSSFGVNYGQGIVLNMFFGASINTAQAISNQLSGQLSSATNMMMKALNPVLAKSEGAKNRALMIKTTIMGSKLSFYLLIIFFIPILIEIPYILFIWLENVPEFTVIFVRLLLIRNLIEQLFKTLASSIIAHGNIRNYQIISSILAPFPLIISYVLFKVGYPPYTLYVAFIIYSILASGIILFFTHYNYKFPVSTFVKDTLLRSIFVFMVSYFISYLPLIYFEDGFFRLCLVSILSFIISLLSIWFIGFSKDEKKEIKEFLMPIVLKIPVLKLILNKR